MFADGIFIRPELFCQRRAYQHRAGVVLIVVAVVTLCDSRKFRRTALILGIPATLLALVARLVPDEQVAVVGRLTVRVVGLLVLRRLEALVVAAEGDESNPEAIWTYCGYAAAAAGPLPIAACGSRLDRGSAFRIRCYLCCPRRLDDLPLRADHGRPLFRR